MAKQNFLLGRGERLTEDVIVRSGGAPKEAPYTFLEARERLTPMLVDTVSFVNSLPNDACPRDQTIISLTLNPEYIAKSFFPSNLLKEVGIEVIGSRPKKITPAKKSPTKKHPEGRQPVETVTTELFARGTRSAIRSWQENILNWTPIGKVSEELISIEEVKAPLPGQKIKGKISGTGILPMEIVLHADEIEAQTYMLQEFSNYLKGRNLAVEFGRRFFAKGLCFLEIDASAESIEEIATFSMVRALRRMPELRLLRPPIRSSVIPTMRPQLPEGLPLSNSIRVAIFDGGIPENHPLTQWVTPYELPNMTPASEEDLSHGVAVTSAALFGHIDPKQPIPLPYSSIDHYRVLDEAPGQNPHELYEILDRIENVLAAEEYDFINLSLGPCLPIEDDDIHAWTAVLDDRLARTSTLAAIAVGNDGEGDSILGLDRIQVPSDCVNALAIGACDSPDKDWQRAPYSSIGPGRSPGLIKPDLVDFGGVFERPFIVIGSEITPTLTAMSGTSFATPSVIRMATGVRAHFGANLNHLAIRTLLIHTAEESEHDHKEVGWGRAARNLNDIVLCDDDTIRIVYQGEISPSKYIRAAIPVPAGVMSGRVLIKATLCYKSQTDPHHPSNYTQAGLEPTFRPHDGKFTRDAQLHPDSRSFFGTSGAGATEEELRRNAWKWENCLHDSKRMLGSSLQNPCFDIHYHSRLEGRKFSPDQNLAYALVVTVHAKKIVDLYDQVVRKYATLLEPIRPILDIPVRT